MHSLQKKSLPHLQNILGATRLWRTIKDTYEGINLLIYDKYVTPGFETRYPVFVFQFPDPRAQYLAAIDINLETNLKRIYK